MLQGIKVCFEVVFSYVVVESDSLLITDGVGGKAVCPPPCIAFVLTAIDPYVTIQFLSVHLLSPKQPSYVVQYIHTRSPLGVLSISNSCTFHFSINQSDKGR